MARGDGTRRSIDYSLRAIVGHTERARTLIRRIQEGDTKANDLTVELLDEIEVEVAYVRDNTANLLHAAHTEAEDSTPS